MSQANCFIRDLSYGKQKSKMCVRVIRQWTIPSLTHFKNFGGTKMMGMLLLDEQGSKIEATIKGLPMQKFGSIMKEGECYYISNFRLARNVGWPRLKDNTFKLNFTISTNIERILATTIADYRYDFVPFRDIGGRGNNDCDLIASRLMLNHDIPEVTSFKNKHEGCFFMYGIVERVDEQKGWYYETCLPRRDVDFCKKCSGYPKFIIPRYKVELLVSDPSGSTTFVLFDDIVVMSIVGKTTADIIDKITYGGDEIVVGEYGPIPKKITSLLHRSFLFQIKKNIIDLISHHTYVVLNLTSRDDLISKFFSS
ncbi:hypothetical protein ACFE04_019122 [Oxalis oulophora]